MNVNELGFSLADVQWLVMAALAVYTWFIGRMSASAKEIVEIRERVVALEVDMKNMPSESSVRELIGRLERLTAYNEGTKEQLNALQHTVSRIDDYLRIKG